MDQEEHVALIHILRDFMSASAKLSACLEQNHPLDLLQYHDVASTVMGLRAKLLIWEGKNLPRTSEDEGA